MSAISGNAPNEIIPFVYWSALATVPAETSAEAKEAFTFNKIRFH